MLSYCFSAIGYLDFFKWKLNQDQLSAYRSQFEGTEVKTWSETKVEGHKQTAIIYSQTKHVKDKMGLESKWKKCDAHQTTASNVKFKIWRNTPALELNVRIAERASFISKNWFKKKKVLGFCIILSLFIFFQFPKWCMIKRAEGPLL